MHSGHTKGSLPLSQLSWSAAVFYLLVHALCLGVVWTGLSWSTFALFAGCFAVRMFALTVGFHRYFAHRAFKTSRWFQLALALAGSTTLQGGVIWWAETHRRHHRNADTSRDLHSPHFQGFFYSHYLWFLDRRNRVTHHEAIPDLARYPELRWLDTWHFVPFAAFCAGLWHFRGWEGVLWGGLLPTVLIWEITHWVQSFSHAWGGYRRYACADLSRNHWPLGVLALGEFHNNHHRFSSSARQGHVWWEIDVGWYVLRLWAALGLVWDLKTPANLSQGTSGANDEHGESIL